MEDTPTEHEGNTAAAIITAAVGGLFLLGFVSLIVWLIGRGLS